MIPSPTLNQRVVVSLDSPPLTTHSGLPSPPISPVSASTPELATTTSCVRAEPTKMESPFGCPGINQSHGARSSQSQSHAEVQCGDSRVGLESPSSSYGVNRTRSLEYKARTRRTGGSPLTLRIGVGGGQVSTTVTAPISSSSPITTPMSSMAGSVTVQMSGQVSAEVKAKRRQSSIAYFTPMSPSPRDTRPMSLSLGEGVEAKVTGKRTSGTWAGGGSKRASVIGMGSVSGRESVCEVDWPKEREREPLTLVEKHADLLHFIAQKERKCLELRDQLAIHEKELAELKRKWERIVNRGFVSTNDVHSHSSTAATHLLNSSLGGVALGGLKEGVRMLTSGITEVIQDLEPPEKEKEKRSVTRTPPAKSTPTQGHTQRESDSSTSVSLSTGTGSHFSTSSMSSIWESPNGDVVGEKETVATAPSLSRAGSLTSRMHKRTSVSRTGSRERTTPPSAFVSGLSPRATTVEFGEFVSSPAISTLDSVPKQHASTRPMSMQMSTSPSDALNASWMDNMGKKLEELQKGQMFSKGGKRASVLLAGVSQSIASALLPGPTATTPVISSPRVSSKGVENWLDEEEEQTKHVGEMMKPVVVSRTGTKMKTTKGCQPNTVSSFDDDWNW